MRICVMTVASYAHGIGGMQRATADLVLGLTREGHDVEVVTARHPDGLAETTFNGALWHFLDVPTKFKRLPGQHSAWQRASYAEFVRLHRERPFDVVHSESLGALGLLQKRAHPHVVPVVVKFHGNMLGLVKASLRRARSGRSLYGAAREGKHAFRIAAGWLLTRGEPYLVRSCEAIVPSQQQLDDTVRSHLLRRAHVHVVPNGIDATAFAPRPRGDVRAALGLPPSPLLVAVGRLNREKGFGVALDALADLPGALLAIVGEGEERRRLEQQVDRLGLVDRVRFVGACPPDEVAAYLAAADVFLFPTERDEAAPVVLLEAMASGTPVVASELGGIPEVVGESGVAGMLVRPGDSAALGRATRKLLDDAALRERMAAAARERVLAEYTIEHMVRGTVDVYRIAIAAARA
jgi:glycosyltransferase involved in cell wall biosynthesis